MRSLSLRIALASLGTVLVSLAGFLVTFFWMTGPAFDRFIQHFQTQLVEDTVAAYERGGPEALGPHLARLDRSLEAEHLLLDAEGHSLLDGTDQSALLALPAHRFGPPHLADGRGVLVQASADGRYRLVRLAVPPFDVWDFAPYYALILAAIAGLSWMLASGIVVPLREVAAAVDRFGRGDLTVRVASTRRDEIGQLGRAFNEMANRTETLLAAERRLLQDISHELRSPLARLHIAVELARTADDRDAATARTQKEVDRLSRLVGSLIEVTRAEGDPSARRIEAVDLSAVLRGVVSTCTLEAEAHQCRLRLDDAGVGIVQGDPELLQRAIENVVRNAIRYAPDDTEVVVRATRVRAEVLISVRDVGPGVPDELLHRLTQPFFRVEDARDYSPSGGVGLGLSIAQRAVQVHRGRLEVENARPGLRVTIAIPA